MKIEKIIVRNFRLLKDFSIDLENGLSLVIGKNNVGKTSLLLILDQFLGNRGESKRSIKFNDLNLDAQEDLKHYMENPLVAEKDYTPISISLRLIMSYSDSDILANVSPLLMDLDVDNHYLAIGFDYWLPFAGYEQLHKQYGDRKTKFDNKYKEAERKPQFDTIGYLNDEAIGHFKLSKKSIKIDKGGRLDEEEYVDLAGIPEFNLENVIRFQCIGARREVDNRDVDKTLSTKTSDLYKTIEENKDQTEAKENFIDQLRDTDAKLTTIYANIFSDIVKKIRKFGGVSPDDTVIKVLSTLQHRELLKGNTTVKYEHDNKDLPENFNGLGYMNLISIIFDIYLAKTRFAQRRSEGVLAEINLLFIEEPEAHTHPQMQYIFIKNIKELLHEGIKDEYGTVRPLQYIVSTHSSHIVSDSDYDDIKYLNRVEGKNEVKAKSLKSLSEVYENKDHLRFLKQYITINRSELFFADKVILIEGDTERILLPAIIKKLDKIAPPEKSTLPLMSQNISIIEAGAHAEIFVKLLNFLELKKVLVLTDFDCCSSKGHHGKERYAKGTGQVTTNTALKYFFKEEDCDSLVALTEADKCFAWDATSGGMAKDSNGCYMVCYQTEENGYQPRSFEDDFIALNKKFIKEKTFTESAVKKDFVVGFDVIDKAYDVAEKVKSKAAFAFEILLNSEEAGDDPFGGWAIPTYMTQGLMLLRK